MTTGVILFLLLGFVWLAAMAYFISALEKGRGWAVKLARVMALAEGLNRYHGGDGMAQRAFWAIEEGSRPERSMRVRDGELVDDSLVADEYGRSESRNDAA